MIKMYYILFFKILILQIALKMLAIVFNNTDIKSSPVCNKVNVVFATDE